MYFKIAEISPIIQSVRKVMKTLHIYIKSLITMLLVTIATQVGFSQSYDNLTVTNGLTSYYEAFTLTGIMDQNWTSSQGEFIITFDNRLVVPATISTQNITISNGVDPAANPSSVSVSGNVITIRNPVQWVRNPPANVKNQLTITISASAKIRNPSTPATAVTVNVVSQAIGGPPNGFDINGAARTYNVTQSSTQITAAAVTPNTSVEFRTAKYTFGFSVGQGGFLTAGVSSITMVMPTGTIVPDGSISGVSLNSTPASTVGNSATRTLTLTVPIAVDNLGSISVVFEKTSGLKNPGQGTTYTAAISTSSEPTVVNSSTYSIASAANLSFASIDLSSSTVNATSSFSVSVVLSNTGGVNSSLGDLFSIKFPSSVTLPASIAGSNVTFFNTATGFSGTPTTVFVAPASDSLYFAVPINAAASVEVQITFSAAAGIITPAIPGSYNLFASSYESDKTVIDAEATSNPFSIFAANTSISSINVTPNPATENVLNSQYTVTGVVGSNGRLVAGSIVSVTFPSSSFSALSGTFQGTPIVTIGASSNVVTFTVPSGVTVNNGGSFTAIIQGVNNPAGGSYTLSVSSSAEPTAGVSAGYTIGATSIGSATVSFNANTDTTNATGDYTVTLTGASVLNGPSKSNQTITVQFPSGTVIPATIANANVTITGNKAITVTSVVTNPASNTVTVGSSTNSFIPSSVRFAVGAGIVNPVVAASNYYVVKVHSSENTSPKSSGFYNFSGSRLRPTVNSVSSTPNTYSSNPQIDINFTTASLGRIVGGAGAGSDTVFINFDSMVIVPVSAISPSHIKIGGVATSAVGSLSTGAGGEIYAVVPTGVDVGNSSASTISILSNAGLTLGTDVNPTATSTVQVRTSSNRTYSNQTANLSLQETVDLTVGNVTISDSRKNASTSYTINVTIGTGKALVVGDDIIVTLPTQTFVPATIDKANVLVNGSNPTTNPVVSGNQITLLSPTAIASEASFTIQFSSLAGLLNPSTPNTYTLTVATEKEPTGDTSNSYTITAASSTVSQATVALSSYTPAATGVTYTINYNTGAYGRLLNGTSQMYIDFPAGTGYVGVTATVNGVTATIARNVNRYTVTVPASTTILNNGSVSVVFTGITNPVAGFYNIGVSTSIEASVINSITYEVSNTPPVTFTAMAVSIDTVNTIAQYTFSFDINANLNAGGTITATFPTGSVVPASIANTNVTVNGTPSTSVTTNIGNRTATVTIPALISSAAASPHASVIFTTGAAIYTPKEPTSYTYKVRTSNQPVNAESAAITFFPSTNTKITILSIVGNPQSVSEAINWTFTFRTGSKGALQSGVGTFTLEFGQSIFNNANVPTSSVFVSGVNPPTVVTDAVNKTLVVTVPNAVTVGNTTDVTVYVNTGANIWPNPNLLKRPSKANPNDPLMPSTEAIDEYSVYSSAETSASLIQTNPLPIELTSFKVLKATEEGFPYIVWTTATELNNYGFQLQRKHTGFDDSFKKVAFIEGAGTSFSPLAYSYVDEDMQLAGEYLYKLIQYDYNGDFKEYGPIFYIFAAPEKFELSDAFPNPFNPTTNIRYSIAAPEKIQIYVYDTLGRQVATLVNQQMAAGTYTVTFDAAQLSSGMYFIRMIAQNQSYVKKILLVK